MSCSVDEILRIIEKVLKEKSKFVSYTIGTTSEASNQFTGVYITPDKVFYGVTEIKLHALIPMEEKCSEWVYIEDMDVAKAVKNNDGLFRVLSLSSKINMLREITAKYAYLYDV